MGKSLLYPILTFLLVSHTACFTSGDEENDCYSDEEDEKEMESATAHKKPHFSGGHDSLVNFFSANIDLESFAAVASYPAGLYTDTANVEFLVHKNGGISQLSVKTTGPRKFNDEITRLVRQSSCNWVAAGSGKKDNEWYQFDLYFSLEKFSEKSIRTTMTINEL